MYSKHYPLDTFQKKLDRLYRVCKARYQKNSFLLPVTSKGQVSYYRFRVKQVVVCAHAGVQQPWLMLCVGHQYGPKRSELESRLMQFIDRELMIYFGVRDACTEVHNNVKGFQSRIQWMVDHNVAMGRLTFMFPSEYPQPKASPMGNTQTRRRYRRH
jgi:hypothetical protein